MKKGDVGRRWGEVGGLGSSWARVELEMGFEMRFETRLRRDSR